ncbi:MAG: hypothetical protein HYU39_02250 [Thaumarchaeota archaeon]|nr:hypothetical protein [Nitrososphaerota archaeon]
MIVRKSVGVLREVTLEHSPFLASSVEGMDMATIEGISWMVIVKNRGLRTTLGAPPLERYWFGGDKAFRQANDVFTHLSSEMLNKVMDTGFPIKVGKGKV